MLDFVRLIISYEQMCVKNVTIILQKIPEFSSVYHLSLATRSKMTGEETFSQCFRIVTFLTFTLKKKMFSGDENVEVSVT